MKISLAHRIVTISLIILMYGTNVIPLSTPQSVNQSYEETQKTAFTGQILFAPIDSTKTYLIDSTGMVNHTWSSSYFPGEAVRWLGNGTILRTIKMELSGFGGEGGGIQKITWDGTITWEFFYNTSEYHSHHDIMPLPNGNVLMIAWETKTRAEAIAAGRNPDYVSNTGFIPDHIIEVQPTGPTSGDIVWEWHVWDHLIQDYDSSKANYGVVADHPELVDINYRTSSIGDWMHTNSIDYHEEFDQILLSVCYFDEIWVIDHSTTTAEAASHSGGRNGKGGDLLFRWGNPETYRAGSTSDKKLFNQHDATWIDKGYPGAGNILVFNNGVGRQINSYSTVDEIVPPVNDNGIYYLEPGSSYGPENLIWSYTGSPSSMFYAPGISGAQRLKDGNTLICDGLAGKFFTVTSDGMIIWQYVNPYPLYSFNNVFKIVYIPPQEEPPQPNDSDLDCSGSLSWTHIKPGTTVTGSFQVRNIGNSSSLLNWKVNTSSFTWGTWSYTPTSGVNLSPADGQVTVQVSVIAPDEKNADFNGYIRVENIDNPDDFEKIPVILKTPIAINTLWWTLLNQFLSYLLQRNPFFGKLSIL
jgi:hypothetical protein